MPLVTIILGIILLFILIAVIKLNGFISFILVSITMGMALGMELTQIVNSIQSGLGSTLGFLVMILGFGAMLGKLVADSGAAQRITSSLTSWSGPKYIQWALVLAGFIIGIPMFYSVGFVILVPLVFTVAASTGLPLIYVGLPMLAALSVTHGFLPPHPAPTAISQMFEADLGKTLLYGIIVAIPAIIIGGPLFSRTIKHIHATPLKEFHNPVILKESELPGMAISVITALLPVLLILAGTIATNTIIEESKFRVLLEFIGNPVIALLFSVVFAICTLGVARGKKMIEIMASLSKSISSITMVLLIIGGAGALKQILVDSGVSDYIGALLQNSKISPIILAWLIATVIRICVGSATVAGLTAAGIVLPLASQSGVSSELLVLSIGAGSLMCSHVNDGGFWMFKEYFNLSIKETLSTWTIMETTVGITGLIGILILDTII